MSAVLELKYFNSFVLKKIKAIAAVKVGTTVDSPTLSSGASFTISALGVDEMNVGQEISMEYIDPITTEIIKYKSTIIARASDTAFTAAVAPPNFTGTPVPPATVLVMTFGKIIDFDQIPVAYKNEGNPEEDWLIEEARIRGGYNNVSVDFGVKAYIIDDEADQSHKFSGLIHSGIFNSRTGFNASNQFPVSEDITRTIDPANGSIQKLYAEDTNLIIFQESKVSKSLIDKDAIYSAEGNASVTSRNLVIGQNVAFGGEFGISTDPESFAVNGYRKYFTDRDQNIVCRLSMDGITPISSFGLIDFFRDRLPVASTIRGGWDAHNKQYILSIDEGDSFATAPGKVTYNTLSFDESSKGWASRYSFKPNSMFSLNNNFFSTYKGKIYQHHQLAQGTTARGVFYGVTYNSSINFVFNGNPSSNKNFQTINYEGDTGWKMDSFVTNSDTAYNIDAPFLALTLEQMENNMMVNNFKVKEGKYFGTLMNSTPAQTGEVVFGTSSSGIKGFYGEVIMTMPNNNTTGNREMFADSTTFVPSS